MAFIFSSKKEKITRNIVHFYQILANLSKSAGGKGGSRNSFVLAW